MFVCLLSIDRRCIKGNLLVTFVTKINTRSHGISGGDIRAVVPDAQFKTCFNCLCSIIAQQFPVCGGQGEKAKICYMAERCTKGFLAKVLPVQLQCLKLYLKYRLNYLKSSEIGLS